MQTTPPSGENLPAPDWLPGEEEYWKTTPLERARKKLEYAELIQKLQGAPSSEEGRKAVERWLSQVPEKPRISEVELTKKIGAILQEHAAYTQKLNAALLGLLE